MYCITDSDYDLISIYSSFIVSESLRLSNNGELQQHDSLGRSGGPGVQLAFPGLLHTSGVRRLGQPLGHRQRHPGEEPPDLDQLVDRVAGFRRLFGRPFRHAMGNLLTGEWNLNQDICD